MKQPDARGVRLYRLSKKSGTVKISQQIRNVLWIPKIGLCVPYFRSSLPILSLRGGRIFAPDAAIFNDAICHPKTKYGRAERRSRSYVFCYKYSFLLRAPRASPRDAIPSPFKIATAALRPRNDTKLRRFWVKNSLLCKVFDTLNSRTHGASGCFFSWERSAPPRGIRRRSSSRRPRRTWPSDTAPSQRLSKKLAVSIPIRPQSIPAVSGRSLARTAAAAARAPFQSSRSIEVMKPQRPTMPFSARILT